MTAGTMSRRNLLSLALATAAAGVLKPMGVFAQEPSLTKDEGSGLDYCLAGNTVNPKKILVALHGTGDNALSFKKIGDIAATVSSDLLVLVPNGPVSMSEIFPKEQLDALKASMPGYDPEKGRNWTGVAKIAPDATDDEKIKALQDTIDIVAVKVNSLIDTQLKKYQLKSSDLAIYGFSAGGSMAMETGMQRSEACAALISHSGYLLSARTPLSKPKTLFMVGDQEVANPQLKELYESSAEVLKLAGLSVTERILENTAHTVNQQAFTALMNFVVPALGLVQAPAPGPSAKPNP